MTRDMRRAVFVIGVFAMLALIVGSHPLKALPPVQPYTQCTVDCVPCAGADDPFCAGSQDPGPGALYCSECRNYGTASAPLPTCVQVPQNTVGYNSCAMVFQGTKPVSCTVSGGFCENTTVTP